MNSPDHGNNMLRRDFEHIGSGLSRGAPVTGVARAGTYATDFRRR